MEKYINYASASNDVTMVVAEDLKKHKYKKHSLIKNVKLIEKDLRKYTFIKLEDFNAFDDIYINYPLIELLERTNNAISDKENRRSFFAQYTHCIIQLIGELKKQPQITWKEDTIDEKVKFVHDGKIIKEIITDKTLQAYQVPTTILQEYKKILKNK